MSCAPVFVNNVVFCCYYIVCFNFSLLADIKYKFIKICDGRLENKVNMSYNYVIRKLL